MPLNRDDRAGPSTTTNYRWKDMQMTSEGTRAEEMRAASVSGSAMKAEGVELENYYTALAGEEADEGIGDETAEDSAGGHSEAPSIKSPLKDRARGTSTKRQRTTERTRKVIRSTKRKGSRVLGFVTPEPTTTTA